MNSLFRAMSLLLPFAVLASGCATTKLHRERANQTEQSKDERGPDSFDEINKGFSGAMQQMPIIPITQEEDENDTLAEWLLNGPQSIQPRGRNILAYSLYDGGRGSQYQPLAQESGDPQLHWEAERAGDRYSGTPTGAGGSNELYLKLHFEWPLLAVNYGSCEQHVTATDFPVTKGARWFLCNVFNKSSSSLYLGYELESWWYAFDFGKSSPFWQTNYEPYLRLEIYCSWRNEDGTCKDWSVSGGLAHESNGDSGGRNRSWNYWFAQLEIPLMLSNRMRHRLDASLRFRGMLLEGWPSEYSPQNPNILDYQGWLKTGLRYTWALDTFSGDIQIEAHWGSAHNADYRVRYGNEPNMQYPPDIFANGTIPWEPSNFAPRKLIVDGRVGAVSLCKIAKTMFFIDGIMSLFDADAPTCPQEPYVRVLPQLYWQFIWGYGDGLLDYRNMYRYSGKPVFISRLGLAITEWDTIH